MCLGGISMLSEGEKMRIKQPRRLKSTDESKENIAYVDWISMSSLRFLVGNIATDTERFRLKEVQTWLLTNKKACKAN